MLSGYVMKMDGMKFEYYKGPFINYSIIDNKYTWELSDYKESVKKLIDSVDDKYVLDSIIEIVLEELGTKHNIDDKRCKYILEI